MTHFANFDAALLRCWLPRILAVMIGISMPYVAYHGVAELTSSQLFAVEAVEVRGVSRLDEMEVRAAAGFARARNILTVDPVAIQSAVESHPWVRSVEVTVHPRSRNVFLDVTERTLAGISVGAEAWLIDTHGERIRPWRAADGWDVPVLVTGRESDPTSAELADLLATIARIGASDALADKTVTEIHDRGARGHHIWFDDGFELSLGRDDENVRLDALASAIRAQRAPVAYALADGENPNRIVIGHPEGAR